MSAIHLRQRSVYYAPTRGRHYFTKAAAARQEAAAMIRQKYPTEPQERDEIGITYSGWHWTEDERLVAAHTRLTRLLLRRFSP